MPDVKRVVRKEVKADDDAFAMMMKQEELTPDATEYDPLAQYALPPYEEWNPPF